MVEPTAPRLLIPVLPIISLYGERHFIIANSISIVLFLPAFPMVTRRSIIPRGWSVSPEKPISGALHLLSLDRMLTLRFVQLFLNKQLEGVDRPQDFIPSRFFFLPRCYTFMRKKHSTEVLSCMIHPLTPSIVRSSHSIAARSTVQRTAIFMILLLSRTAEIQRTADFQVEKQSELDLDTTQSTANEQGTITPRILNVLRWKQDLQGPLVQFKFMHIPPPVGFDASVDLNIIWETAESSDDDF
ncbi:hypothetical protein Tco_1343371 [Tanacetum coccineum]